MKVHIIYTPPKVQTENNEQICKDIMNVIVDKMFIRNMKIHIVHTVGDQSENNEQICKDVVNDIVDKMFMQ